MRILRPLWLTHKGEKKDFEIYSCHVSPDGTRLVTAAGDGFVRIWSTEAIRRSTDRTYTGPNQLASMSYHTGTIHAVRFAGNGSYLASGADDKLVVIYRLDPNARPQQNTFGSSDAAQTESWRVYRRLIGHENDVQDLGWSCDSSILVSVGLDSKVVVWSGHTFEKLKTLSGHQSHVKGLAFDPANKYFATASDDRTLRIWRFTSPGPNSTAHDQVNNFQLEKSISSPFVASPLTTYFRRCSWSPDGRTIASANAVNGPVSSIALTSRGIWDGDTYLIGHEGPAEVCAFSPRLYEDNPSGEQTHTDTTHGIIAVGGQDKALSLWTTSRPRPLAVAHDVCQKSIVDLAWALDGQSLYVASLDGTIFAMMFDTPELGYPMKEEENEKALAKYGGSRRGAGLLQSTSGLILEEMAKESEMRDVQGRMGALMGDNAPQTKIYTAQSELTRDSADQMSKPIERASDTAKETQGKDLAEEDEKLKLNRLKNRMTITKEGKKRITPLLLSVSSSTEGNMPEAQVLTSAPTTQQTTGQSGQVPLDLSQPYDGLPAGGLKALLLGTRRRYLSVDEETETDHLRGNFSESLPIVVDSPNGLRRAAPNAINQESQQIPKFIRPAVVNPNLSTSSVRLAVPKVRAHFVQPQCNDSAKNDTSKTVASSAYSLEIRNPKRSAQVNNNQAPEPCRVTVTEGPQLVFQDFIPHCALLATGSSKFWAIATEDGSIHAWSLGGKRVLNAMVLESQTVLLASNQNYLLSITAMGVCHVYDMVSMSSPHPPVSLAPILDSAIHSLAEHPTKAPAINSARLSSEGYMLITLSNGQGFAYNPRMFVWQRLSELWWLVGSQYWNTIDTLVQVIPSQTTELADKSTEVSAGILPFLERCTTNATMARGRARLMQTMTKQLLSHEGYEGFESIVSVAHLEHRLAAAMMLGAREDFRVYLFMYAKRIGVEGSKTKVEELLSDIAGEIFATDKQKSASSAANSRCDRFWSNPLDMVCGWPRLELLKSVLLIFGKNRDLQGLTLPYVKIMRAMESMDMASSDQMVH